MCRRSKFKFLDGDTSFYFVQVADNIVGLLIAGLLIAGLLIAGLLIAGLLIAGLLAVPRTISISRLRRND
jgi:hypothetical protein